MSGPAEAAVRVRGTCVEVLGVGVLLRGESGSGKSDLALRLIDEGAGLVADDYVDLRRDGEVLRATAPAEIAGLIEVRGLGLLRRPRVTEAALGLVLDLTDPAAVPRMPDPAMAALLGLSLPLLPFWPFEASATAKIRAWVTAGAELPGSSGARSATIAPLVDR